MDNEIIEYNNVVKILKNEFSEFLIDSDYEELPYIISGDFAKYIVKNIIEENTNEIIKCFNFIETLYLYGTDKTKELATIGFLENLQNELLNYKLFNEYKIIEKNYLGKESKNRWKEVEYYWNKIKWHNRVKKLKNISRRIINILKTV